jgi:lipoprotein-anchoring transpeptidase ErfK/SrfK
MRRHVENPIENPEKENFSILLFFAMWVVALLALSAAAHGEDRPQQTAAAAPAQQIANLERTDKPVAQPKAQHHLKTAKNFAIKDPQPQPAQQPLPAEQITLSRFILISIPDRQLALIDDGQIVKIYSIAVGADHTPSPEGDFTIISRVTNPTWAHKGKVVGPGKDNPVGSRWMGLSLKGYGIHGTNAPSSIGKAASHGCFRMGKKDVEELFKLVRVGDVVAVRAERDELVAQVFGSANSDVQVAATTTTSADGGQE